MHFAISSCFVDCSYGAWYGVMIWSGADRGVGSYEILGADAERIKPAFFLRLCCFYGLDLSNLGVDIGFSFSGIGYFCFSREFLTEK